jgi:hypothetical protein
VFLSYGTIMNIFSRSVLVAFIFASLYGCAIAPDRNVAWLERVPNSEGTRSDWRAVAPHMFFEVSASRLASAEWALTDVSFLREKEPDYCGRPDFKCALPSKTFLIRAEYVNGGTGSFGLAWAGSALVVSHSSLGGGGPPSRSVLVACLDQVPTAVYGHLSTAL